MKKFLVSIVLIFTLSTSAFAFAPLAIPAAYWVASSILHVATAAGIYYAMKTGSGSGSSVDGSANTFKPSQVAWVNTADLNLPNPQVQSKNVTANMSLSQLKTVVQANDASKAKYSAINETLRHGSLPTPVQPGNSPLPIDSVVATSGGALYQVTSGPEFQGIADHNLSIVNPVNPGGGALTQIMYPGGVYSNKTPWPATLWFLGDVDGSYSRLYNQQLSGPVTPAYRDSTPIEVATALSSTGPPSSRTPINSAYQEQLDMAFQDPNYVPTFTDDTTGLPYAPPPNSQIATPAQLAAYNTSGGIKAAATDAQAVAAASSAAGLTAANAAATAASGAVGAAAAALAGNPSDLGLQAKLADAQLAAAKAASAAAAAKTADDKLKASQAAAALKDDTALNDTAAGVPGDSVRKSLDFTPFHSLKGVLASTFPFNLASTVAGYYSAFTAAPAAPVFDLALPLDQSIHVDLTVFNPIAALIRFLVGSLLSIGCVYYVIHFFRGIS